MPPATLYHGSTAEAAERIKLAGLLPMGRQYVHLSADVDTAEAVGRQKTGKPVILLVRAVEAHENSVKFYLGNEKVWLADSVPARFIG
jgi:putative RNA 2'-phosphotransferase